MADAELVPNDGAAGPVDEALPALGAGLSRIGSSNRPGPFTFQYRVLKALILRDLASRYAHSRLGPVLSVLLPVLSLAVLMMAFGLKGKTTSANFPLGVFIMTGYPLWTNFQGIYQRVIGAANKSDPLLMFPQITQLDLIVSTIILEAAINTVVFVVMVVGVIVVMRAPFPEDPIGVMLVFWSCAWIGSSFGLILSSVGRLFPLALTVISPFMRFGMWFSGVLFMVDRLPAWSWPYLKWNPILHAIEGARQLWTGYPSPMFDPGYILSIGFIMTTAGFVLERITRRYVGP